MTGELFLFVSGTIALLLLSVAVMLTLLRLVWVEPAADVVALELADLLAEDRLQLPETVLEQPYPLVQLHQDPLLHGSPRHEREDREYLGLLPETVDPADPLLDHHGIPRQVVVDQVVAELEIQPLAADLGRDQNTHGRVILEPPHPPTALVVFGPLRVRRDITRDPQRGVAGGVELSLQVAGGADEIGEDQHFRVGILDIDVPHPAQ